MQPMHASIFRLQRTCRCSGMLLALLLAPLLSGLMGTPDCQAEAEPVKRPNIVFLLTDDQRFDSLGCMGNTVVKTPAIDQLAREGVVFDQMFCTTSICAVSRASFMTGQYARRHGINDFRTSYTAEQLAASFPLQLRASGYRTGLIGKWGIGGPLPVQEYNYWKGFPGQARYFPEGKPGEGPHLEAIMREQAVEFITGNPADQPFLLQLYTKAAHCQDNDPWPFQPEPRLNSLYATTRIPLPPTATEHHFQILPEFLKTSEARTRWHVRFDGDELAQKSLRDYYRLVSGLDDTVAAIRRAREVQGVADNTVFIYTSDNGFYLADRGLAGKWFFHEESIRLPLIIHDPRHPATHGTRRQEVVLNIDLAPTIFELAGLKPDAAVQGTSLLPLVRGETETDWRTDFLYEHLVPIKTIPQSEGVRTPHWKYVRYPLESPALEQLFDLQHDPLEEHDLAANPKHAATMQQLREYCNRLISEAK